MYEKIMEALGMGVVIAWMLFAIYFLTLHKNESSR